MRAIPLLPLALCGLALTTLAWPRVLQDPDEHADESVLAQHMHRVEDALGGLRRSVRDPQKTAESIEAVLVCLEASQACKREVPAMAATLPEAERAAFVQAYRVELIGLQRALLDLEQGLVEGKEVETLRELYKAIKGLEDPAHERFTEDG